MSDPFVTTAAWRAAHAGAVCGVLALRGVANPPRVPALDREKEELERDLRARYGGLERVALREVGLLPAYAAYYKRWGQRYHVGLQVESIAQKGKEIPRVAALVEAMFVAELRTQVLTAGHDLDAVTTPIRLDVGTGEERFQTPAGAGAAVKPGDMYMADTRSVLSAVITGPAAYARIAPETTSVLFAAYGVPGVPLDAVEAHLAEIERLVRIVSASADTILRRIVQTEGRVP
jgi:DNA/RNA-binding domain of Phe-tRNA-synthetase-like protein